MTEGQVIESVKRITGAESVRVERKTGDVWSVLLAFPDGPDAYTFQNRMVDVSGDPRMVGFNW